MKSIFVTFVYFVVSLSAFATELQFAGVLGNSGEAGMWLVRSTEGSAGGGVAVDARGRIHTAGGDRILTLNRDGKLLWQTPLPETNWVVGSGTFAIGGRYLYFVAGKPLPRVAHPFSEPNLCRVEIAPGSTAEVLVKQERFQPQIWPGLDVALTATPDGSHVYFGYTSRAGTYEVCEVGAEGSPVRLFTKDFQGGRMSVDEAGHFYLGGNRQVQQCNAHGEPVRGYTPIQLPNLGPVPTALQGTVMLTRDALWDMGPNGFVARFTRAMKPDPGVVVQWDHRLGWTEQIVDAPNGAYYIKSAGGFYVAQVEDEILKLVRRFGSLPALRCLVLTANGYIAVDGPPCADGLQWFDFDNDRADAPPVRGILPSPATQGFADGNTAIAYNISPSYIPREYQPRVKGLTGLTLLPYSPEPFTDGNNIAHGPTGAFDGQLTAVTRVRDFYFAIDAAHHRLARAPAGKPCELMPIEMDPVPMDAVAALGHDELLVSGGGIIRAFQVDATGHLKQLWEMKDFSPEVYVTAAGMEMLVSDTRRHRILLYGFENTLDQPPALQAQFGETNQPGTDLSHLDSPTLVSLQAGRAVVYDAGNQRIMKFRLS